MTQLQEETANFDAVKAVLDEYIQVWSRHGGAGYVDMAQNPLMMMLLLKDDMESADLLLYMMMFQQPGTDGGIQDLSAILPILLLGGGLGGTEGGDMTGLGSILPLLLLDDDEDDDSDLKDLLPILLLGGGLGGTEGGDMAGLGAILPLLLLDDDD